jgi:Family of unknown function (DUF6459)
MPLEQALIEQALTPHDLSSMQVQMVPELWPPAEPALIELPRQQVAAEPADGDQAWPRQFAVLLAEALTGDRPPRQLLPWLSERGRAQLRRLLPLFADGQRARVQRVLTTQPAPDVIEMTLIVAFGPRVRALAVRLKRAAPSGRPRWREKLPATAADTATAASARWVCTDIEAA